MNPQSRFPLQLPLEVESFAVETLSVTAEEEATTYITAVIQNSCYIQTHCRGQECNPATQVCF